MALLMYVLIFAVMFSMLLPLIDLMLLLWSRKKKSWVERADDAHVALYRKRRKIGAQNVRETQLRYLVFLGDEDFYDAPRYGKLKGVYWKPEIVECFIQTKRLRPWQWVKIPKELVRDALGRNLRVKGNGLEPLGNFLKPVYTRDVFGKTVTIKRKIVLPNPGETIIEEEIPLNVYYDYLVLDHEEYLLTVEKSIETEEQKCHALIDAVDTKRRAESMIRRPDYAPSVEGPAEEGPQYDQY